MFLAVEVGLGSFSSVGSQPSIVSIPPQKSGLAGAKVILGKSFQTGEFQTDIGCCRSNGGITLIFRGFVVDGLFFAGFSGPKFLLFS